MEMLEIKNQKFGDSRKLYCGITSSMTAVDWTTDSASLIVNS